MPIIRDRVELIDPSWFERYMGVDTATVGHFADDGVMAAAIKRLTRVGKFCGPALTVRAIGEDSAVVHYAQSMARKGDVIVVDRAGDVERACWGEMVTLGAHSIGAAGAIVDGVITDPDEIEYIGLPVFARGVSALTTRLQGRSGEINTPVNCGGVIVHPGDLVLADSSGVLVVKPDHVHDVYQRALAALEQEKTIRQRIAAGERLPFVTEAAKLIESR